jgi:hypothetical protein
MGGSRCRLGRGGGAVGLLTITLHGVSKEVVLGTEYHGKGKDVEAVPAK